MTNRRQQRLARQLAFTGAKHTELLRAAGSLLTAAAAAAAGADDGDDDAPVVTLLPDGDQWRLLLLRGRSADIAWLVTPDPTGRPPATGPAVIGQPFRIDDPSPTGHLAAVAVQHGGRATPTSVTPTGLVADDTAWRLHGLIEGPGPRLDRAPATTDHDAVVEGLLPHLRQHVADIRPALARALHGTATDVEQEEVLDALGQAIDRYASVDPDGFAALVGLAFDESADLDPAVLGGDTRYGWSANDLRGGMSIAVPWPSTVVDAVQRIIP